MEAVHSSLGLLKICMSCREFKSTGNKKIKNSIIIYSHPCFFTALQHLPKQGKQLGTCFRMQKSNLLLNKSKCNGSIQLFKVIKRQRKINSSLNDTVNAGFPVKYVELLVQMKISISQFPSSPCCSI